MISFISLEEIKFFCLQNIKKAGMLVTFKPFSLAIVLALWSSIKIVSLLFFAIMKQPNSPLPRVMVSSVVTFVFHSIKSTVLTRMNLFSFNSYSSKANNGAISLKNFASFTSSYTVDGIIMCLIFSAFKINFSFPILKNELRKSVSIIVILDI